MANTVPYEVIAGPFTVWAAPVGTAFPSLDVADGSINVAWVKVGSSGPLNYDGPTGVTVEHSQELAPWMAMGDYGVRKIFRSSESVKVRLRLVDLTLEQYALALDGNTVTTTAAGSGTAGYKSIGFSRGADVDTRAILIRGISPYGASYIAQYQIWRAAQTGNPQVVFKKDEPAALDLEWTALIDPSQSASEYTGKVLMQHAVAL